MEPEIARRCLNCGASVRGRAHFCPQCGRPMGEEAAAHRLADEAERVAASLSGRLPDAPAVDPESSPDNHTHSPILDLEEDAARPSVVPPEATAGTASATTSAPPEAVLDIEEVRAGDGATPRSGGPRGGVRGRAAAVGASVGESLKPRVERLREASSVVIDEAAEDPGVRFLVIAAVLFLLFLLLWLLSFTLG
jgi:hypothetical protein